MKRPTRVPASMIVRMNSASNMMAKWYQKLEQRFARRRCRAKICAMPSASEGAPPVRLNRVCLAHAVRQLRHVVRRSPGNPQPDIVATAAAGVAPTMPAGELTAKKTPGSRAQAATIAITATKPSSSIEP